MSFIKIGPVGKEAGVAWDEKGHTQIVQIFIWHSGSVINWIQFQYAENGTRVLSAKHGANSNCVVCVPSKFDVVKLSFPSEYITWISGEISGYGIHGSVQCITFGTNCGTYGPFGKSFEIVRKFSFRLGEDRQFGGFYGTADSERVTSIGVYLKPAMTN